MALVSGPWWNGLIWGNAAGLTAMLIVMFLTR